MKTVFYKIKCITNMHAGTGEANYSIVDREVARDEVTGYPMIHSSGIKGALRAAYIKTEGEEAAKEIFGAEGSGNAGYPGTHKFLDALLISRPMRVYKSEKSPFLPTVSEASVNQYLEMLSVFGKNHYGIEKLPDIDFGENLFLTNLEEDVRVEGEPTGKLSGEVLGQFKKLADVLGENFAVAKTFDGYDLPVFSRTRLKEGKTGMRFWYEEAVPHESVFFFGVIYPDDAEEMDMPSIVQIGGNTSTGCGFVKITRLGEDESNG